MSRPEPTDGRGDWQKFLCRACGLIYDEAEGDPDGGLPPGTRFADIPDDWQCPVCGVTKADFEPYAGPRVPVLPATPTAPRARRAGLVIAGAGIAGWSVAEEVRVLDGAVPITLVTGCAGDAYHKPELSIAFGRGLDPARLVREAGSARAMRLGVRLMPDTFAIGIDPQRRRLRTTRGTLGYSHLVMAQGAKPVVPAVLKPELCWRINSLAAWAALHGALQPASRIVLVGAGMVGCELADDLVRAGHSVTLIDTAPLPLAGLLPDIAGRQLVAALEGAGIRFLGNTVATGLTRTADGTLALATAYETIIADQVVSAIGLATESRLARNAGLAFDRGIVVDSGTLATSVPGIHALGDCISLDGAPCRFIEPIAQQAAAIAHAVLGRPHAGYAHAPPVIRLKTRSRPVEVHGNPVPGATWRTVTDTPDALAMEQWLDGHLAARLAM